MAASGGAARGAQQRSSRKRISLDIRYILNCDDGKAINSRDIEKHLQMQMRKLLQAKRKEHDGARAKLRELKKHRAKLKTEVETLRLEAEALGVAGKAERDPGLDKQVDSVSRRHVVVHDNRLHELENRHRALEDELSGEQFRGRMYKHIRGRTATTLRELSQIVHELQAEHREAELQESQLAREEGWARDEFGRAQQRLRVLQRKIDADLKLWKLELADRERWVRQKALFREMVRTQERHQQELEAAATARPKGGLSSHKHTASVLAAKDMETKLAETLEAQQDEEWRFEEAFRRIGAQTGEPDPAEVIGTVMAQRALQQELKEADIRDRAKMRHLEEQLDTLRQEEHMARFDADATTNRVLAEREAAAGRLEAEAAREKQDALALHQLVEPARAALRGLAAAVLRTDKEVPVETPAELAAALRRVEQRLAAMMERASGLVRTLSDAGAASEGREEAFSLRNLFAAAAALERIAASSVDHRLALATAVSAAALPREGGVRSGAAAAAPAASAARARRIAHAAASAASAMQAAGPGMSPYNVRVAPRAREAGDDGERTDTAGDTLDVNRMAAAGHEVPYEDRTGYDRVADRETIKRRAAAHSRGRESPARARARQTRPAVLTVSASEPIFR